MSALPMVSAVMITGRNLSRQMLANAAVTCFVRQSHAEKELVVVNDGIPLFADNSPRGVREIRVEFSKRSTLGDLRNIGLDAARGDLVVQWDDDDWHHPERIAIQIRHWKPGAAVLLRSQFRYCFRSGSAILFEDATGIHGTILHERIASGRYPSLRKGEDTLFLKNFPRRIVVDNTPSLYLRLCHGDNTWDESHIMGQSTVTAHLCRPVTERQDKAFLHSVLTNDYRELLAVADTISRLSPR